MNAGMTPRGIGLEAAAAGDSRYPAAIGAVSRLIIDQLAYLTPRISASVGTGSQIVVRVERITQTIPLIFLRLDNADDDPAAQDLVLRVLEAMSMELAKHKTTIAGGYIAELAVDADHQEACARVTLPLDVTIPLLTPPPPPAPPAQPAAAPQPGAGDPWPGALIVVGIFLAVLVALLLFSRHAGDPTTHALALAAWSLR